MGNNCNSDTISFSILLTNYNNSKYIEESIKSVLSQTYQNWELIIIDDGSTDESLEKIKPFLKDPRIKLIVHEKNMGCGKSKKDAADHSTNTILGVLDSDDKLDENALKIMVEAYKNYPKYGVIYSTYWKCDSKLKILQIEKRIKQVNPQKTNLIEKVVSNFTTFKNEVYKKSEGFDPRKKSSVDEDMILKLEELTLLKYIDRPLYYYRVHDYGISQRKNNYQVKYEGYLSKLNAYRRRLNTKIPNLSKKQIYSEYYKLIFFKLKKFIKNVSYILRFNIMMKILLNYFPFSFNILLLQIIKKFEFINKPINLR